MVRSGERPTRRSFLARITAGLGALAWPGAAPASADPTSRRSPECPPLSWQLGDDLYRNALSSPEDVATFRMEGDASIAFPRGRMRLSANRDPAEGQAANFVLWCPREFPTDIAISWNFWPIEEPGLCILFFAARGRGGEDALDPGLARRTGEYQQYHSSDLDALHISYFRRRYPEERAFHTCNLRKSHGFHMVAKGADPLPPVPDARPPYRIELIKLGPQVSFAINGLPILDWTDDGTHGPPLAGGKIGFRQMAPLVAEYADLTVRSVQPAAP